MEDNYALCHHCHFDLVGFLDEGGCVFDAHESIFFWSADCGHFSPHYFRVSTTKLDLVIDGLCGVYWLFFHRIDDHREPSGVSLFQSRSEGDWNQDRSMVTVAHSGQFFANHGRVVLHFPIS